MPIQYVKNGVDWTDIEGFALREKEYSSIANQCCSDFVTTAEMCLNVYGGRLSSIKQLARYILVRSEPSDWNLLRTPVAAVCWVIPNWSIEKHLL